MTAKIEPVQKRELGLIVLLIILGDASIGLLVFGSWGIIPYSTYRDTVLIPSIIAIAAITIYALFKFKWLGNRIVTGLWAGAVATLALELFRVPGYLYFRWIPMDTMITVPGMFLMEKASSFMEAKQIMMSSGVPAHLYVASPEVFLAGAFWHFWNGAVMGCTYAILVGKGKWWYAVIWGIIIEIIMMVAPWVMMMMGPFGINYLDGYNFFTLTLIAHLAFGAVLGILVQRFVKDRYSIIAKLRARTTAL